MAEIIASDVIDGVYVVEPTIHGDERGIFIETYRREWFPQGREMIQEVEIGTSQPVLGSRTSRQQR